MTNFQSKKHLGHCDMIVFFQNLRGTGFYAKASGAILNALQNGISQSSEFQLNVENYARANYLRENDEDERRRDCWKKIEQMSFDAIFEELPRYMFESERPYFDDPNFIGTGTTRLILSRLVDHLYGEKESE